MALTGGSTLRASATERHCHVKILVTAPEPYVPYRSRFVLRKGGSTDPGLRVLRSHYTQAGVGPVNVASSRDKGGDQGGCILTSTGTRPLPYYHKPGASLLQAGLCLFP